MRPCLPPHPAMGRVRGDRGHAVAQGCLSAARRGRAVCAWEGPPAALPPHAPGDTVSKTGHEFLTLHFLFGSLQHPLKLFNKHEKNGNAHDETKISTEDSKIQVWVIPTNEELAIALDTLEIATKK